MRIFFLKYKKIIIFELIVFCIAIIFQFLFIKENTDQNVGCAYFECDVVSSTIHQEILLSGYSAYSYSFKFPDLEQFNISGMSADVDGDGKNEEILNICESWSSHCPQYGVIVKDGRVVFSTEHVGISRIKPAEHGGFYVEWIDLDHQMPSLCCPTGHNSTRFEARNGDFVVVEEKEYIY